MERFCGVYGQISIQKHAIHTTADNRRILVMHGHELDTVVQNVRWLAFAGDVGYQFLLALNPAINFFRRRFGCGYWSLSAYAKKRVKDAVSFVGEFEKAIVRYAERYEVDAVLCGHIHSAADRQFGPVAYYNCGDWVETCSALIETHDGAIELLNFNPFAEPETEPARELSSARIMTKPKMKPRPRNRAAATSPARHLESELLRLPGRVTPNHPLLRGAPGNSVGPESGRVSRRARRRRKCRANACTNCAI